MSKLRRRAFAILLVLSILGGLAEVVAYVLTFSSLASGPSIAGYGHLEVANGSLPLLAALVVVTVFAGTRMNRVRFAVGGLALASGVVGAAAGGLWGIGGALANFQGPQQPPELNSLLMALWASGVVIAPAAIVLAVGAALLAGVSAFVRWISLDLYDRAAAKRV